MRGAGGSIHRSTSAEAAWHDFEKEFVVVVRASHHVLGSTSHHVTPLSIEAATELHRQLGDVLTDVMWEGVEREDLPY